MKKPALFIGLFGVLGSVAIGDTFEKDEYYLTLEELYYGSKSWSETSARQTSLLDALTKGVNEDQVSFEFGSNAYGFLTMKGTCPEVGCSDTQNDLLVIELKSSLRNKSEVFPPRPPDIVSIEEFLGKASWITDPHFKGLPPLVKNKDMVEFLASMNADLHHMYKGGQVSDKDFEIVQDALNSLAQCYETDFSGCNNDIQYRKFAKAVIALRIAQLLKF